MVHTTWTIWNLYCITWGSLTLFIWLCHNIYYCSAIAFFIKSECGWSIPAQPDSFNSFSFQKIVSVWYHKTPQASCRPKAANTIGPFHYSVCHTMNSWWTRVLFVYSDEHVLLGAYQCNGKELYQPLLYNTINNNNTFSRRAGLTPSGQRYIIILF